MPTPCLLCILSSERTFESLNVDFSWHFFNGINLLIKENVWQFRVRNLGAVVQICACCVSEFNVHSND